MRTLVALLFSAFILPSIVPAASAKSALKQIGEFVIPEANQGVGVDDKYFYAVDNQKIGKYDKKTGKLVGKWEGAKDGPIIHLDSAMLMDGKIYCAHSNWNDWPMTSSVEIWDAETMQHISATTALVSTGARSHGWISTTVTGGQPSQTMMFRTAQTRARMGTRQPPKW